MVKHSTIGNTLIVELTEEQLYAAGEFYKRLEGNTLPHPANLRYALCSSVSFMGCGALETSILIELEIYRRLYNRKIRWTGWFSMATSPGMKNARPEGQSVYFNCASMEAAESIARIIATLEEEEKNPDFDRVGRAKEYELHAQPYVSEKVVDAADQLYKLARDVRDGHKTIAQQNISGDISRLTREHHEYLSNYVQAVERTVKMYGECSNT